MRVAAIVGLLSSACRCDENNKVVIAPPRPQSIAVRLGFEPKGEATALKPYGLAAAAVLPQGTTLERNEAGAVMTLQGLAVQLRAVQHTDRESRIQYWTRKGIEPRRREEDDDGWLLVGDGEGGAARITIVYRARAGVLCESAPTRDKLVLDEIARVCLSLSPP